MSINHGAGADGVGSATEPGPTVNVGDADSGLYANNKPKSQAENNAPSFERVCKLVQDAVDNIKFDARYGSPLADAPGVEEFRRQYYALMCQVCDGEHRAYIRKKLKVAWAWAGDHQPRRLRDQRGYSLILRDKIFEDGELRADQHRAAMNAAPSAVVEIEAPAASSATMEQPPPEPAGEERAPALQRNLVGLTLTPEDRLVGLIIRHRVPAADVPVTPEHFRNADLQYTWKRWERLGSEVDQLDVDAIRARIDRSRWAMFAIWLIEVAGAPDPNNPIDPRDEIEFLTEQIRGRTEEPPPATDVVEILPPVPATAPLDVVEEAPPESPAPAAPTSPAPAGVIIDEEAPPPPTQPVVKMEQQPSVPYISAARMAEIEAANLEAMLKLASAGVPVFVARLDWNAQAKKWDKQPAIKGWKKAATTDPEIIRRWWRDLPRKLGLPAYRLVPGIWCGHPILDIVVVDADRHGGSDGVSAFEALVAKPGHELPVGPRTLTAGSGIHFVFRQPPGKTKLGNSKGELPGGIDIRGVDGWIVGPGAMRPDGAMWRTADGSPSLIDAFRAGSIPTIPTWFVDIVRAPKPDKPEKPPKAKIIQTKAAKPAPSTAPSSFDKTGTKREKAWARGALKKIVEEIGAMPPDSGRNEKTYRKAFAMGTMVVRGWIDRRTVESEMYSADERNGLVADKDDVRGAIERGLNDGSSCPHEDLPDRRTKAARQQRDSTKAWKNLLPTEIYRLLRVRPYGEHASMEAARDVIAAIKRDGHVIDNLDRRQLGDLLRATFEEFKAIGAMFDRHPSRFLPYDATQEEVDAHLAAVRKARNPDRAKAARERRAHEKLEREQHQPPTNELEARRCAAIIRFLEQHPGPQPIGQLVDGLKRAKAFEDLTNRSRRNAILRLVSPPVGKLRELLIVTIGTARNRKPTLLVELRQ